MAGDAAAYAALGLPPGASHEEVERAYRRLIKDHHPDRAGGDAARAAEITAAYQELCSVRNRKGELILAEDVAARERGFGKLWLLVALLLAATALALPFVAWPEGRPAFRLPKSVAHGRDPMRAPLDLPAIDRAIALAVRIASTGDEMEMTAVSRRCLETFRAAPSVAALDRCAAFDDAVVQLQDRDPLRNRGPFSELAVTGRQWSAAKALSHDYEAIDDRLDAVRLRAELAVAAAEDRSGG